MDNPELLELLKFNFKDDILHISHTTPNRVIVEINPGILTRIAKYLFAEHHLRFIISSAMDTGERFEIFYHFSKDDSGYMVNLLTGLPKENPEIESLVPLFVAADWIEREMHELFGIRFLNHPNLIPLISQGNWDDAAYPYAKRK